MERIIRGYYSCGRFVNGKDNKRLLIIHVADLLMERIMRGYYSYGRFVNEKDNKRLLFMWSIC